MMMTDANDKEPTMADKAKIRNRAHVHALQEKVLETLKKASEAEDVHRSIATLLEGVLELQELQGCFLVAILANLERLNSAVNRQTEVLAEKL